MIVIMKEAFYTLRELADLTDIEPRTIRSYIQQGLLRGPDTLGPKASYSEHHLKRLRTIRLLRERHGLGLGDIRRVVMRAGDDDIDVMELPARYRSPGSGRRRIDEWADARENGEWETSYLFSTDGEEEGFADNEELLHAPGEDSHRGGAESITSPGGELEESAPLATLLRILGEALKNQRVPRTGRAEVWRKVEIVPGIQLHLLGEYTPAELDVIERIADHIRVILLGGA
jgi:DNA-binding transcriptional MerR regulator